MNGYEVTQYIPNPWVWGGAAVLGGAAFSCAEYFDWFRCSGGGTGSFGDPNRDHWATGTGALDIAFRELVVYNTESTGKFGVTADVGGSTRWDCVMHNFDEGNTVAEGATLTIAFTGIVDGVPDNPIGSMCQEKAGGQWDLEVRFIDVNSYTIEAYNNGALVYREENYTGGGGDWVPLGKVDLGGGHGLPDFHINEGALSPPTMEITYWDGTIWDPFGEPAARAIDTLRVIPEDFDPNATGLCSVELTAKDIPEMTIIYVGTSGCMTAPKQMVAWWPLDEDATPGGVSEELVNNNDGAWIGSPTPVVGMVDGALSFDGISNYVQVPNDVSLNFGTGDLSVDAWVKTSASSGAKVVLDKRGGTISNPRGYVLFIYNGNLALQLADGDETNYTSSLLVADANWHHVAATVDRDDANGLKLYVDGVTQIFHPTGRQGSLDNNACLLIGSDTFISSNRFNGVIDEVELFNRVLGSHEIDAIYRSGGDGKCKPESECKKSDINDDGTVNFKDLAIMANCWLDSCP